MQKICYITAPIKHQLRWQLWKPCQFFFSALMPQLCRLSNVIINRQNKSWHKWSQMTWTKCQVWVTGCLSIQTFSGSCIGAVPTEQSSQNHKITYHKIQFLSEKHSAASLEAQSVRELYTVCSPLFMLFFIPLMVRWAVIIGVKLLFAQMMLQIIHKCYLNVSPRWWI